MRMEPAGIQAMHNTPVLQDIIKDIRRCSTTSTTSSIDDLEVTEYRSFPVDDNIFDSISSTRTSLICDCHSGNSSEVGQGVLNENRSGSTAVHDSPQVDMERTSAISDGLIPEVHPKISAVQPQEIDDKVVLRSEDGSQNNYSLSKEHRQTYYVQGDDISPDNLSNCSSAISTVGSNDINTHCPVSHNFMPLLRTHEVWKEIGSDGGILEISGFGISFHVLPETGTGKDRLRKNRQQQNLSSARSRLGSDSTKIDRRMVLALDDVPSIVNDRFKVAIGSMVSVEYGNLELLSQGAVLQIEVNATLNEAVKQNSARICKFGCLIASSVMGPYYEVDNRCYYYGNTLQIYISMDDINRISTGMSCDGVATLRMVPIAIVQKKHRLSAEINVWDGIASMLLWVAVYGPRRSQVCNTCCVSISSTTICPPTISVKKNSKVLSLHLWTAYRVEIRKPQDIQIFLHLDSPDTHATVLPTKTVVEANDMKCVSRINKLMTVKYTKELKTSDGMPSPESAGSPTGSFKGKTNDKFLFSLMGLLNHEVLLAVTFVAPIRSPYRSTPVKRWKRSDRAIPRPASYCGVATDTQKFLHIWYDSQREAVTKLKPAFVIPGSDRLITFSHYAVAITSRLRGKRSKSTSLLLDYYQADTMPLLTNTTIWMQGTSRYKEWYVGYSRDTIGLIHTRCAKIINMDQCHPKVTNRFTVAEFIDILTEPIGDLTFCFSTLKAKLSKKRIDWTLFSSILGFAENYISRVVKEMRNDSTKDIAEKFRLFLDRFSEYCDSGNRMRKVHQDIVRALLYMEEYNLVVEIITDFCIWTLSQKLGNFLDELQTVFDSSALRNLPTPEDMHAIPKSSTSAAHCMEYKEVDDLVFDWLCKQRKRWSGNDEEFMKHLHRVVGQLQKCSHKMWTPFSYALILILSIPSLCQN